MKVEFYYWGNQCPLNGYALTLLEQYRDRLEIICQDITDQPELAGALGMFYPTLTIAGGKRYFAPLRPAMLDAFSAGKLPEEKPYCPTLSEKRVAGKLELLTRENMPIACRCTGSDCGTCGKENWLAETGETVFGVLNSAGDQLLGGAEYLPSVMVPYDVPKGDDIAFVTCLYCSSPEGDYKSAPLAALESYLSGKYRYLEAVSDEVGVFPNGNLSFFLKCGYRDLGLLREERGYCRLHLVRKEL